MRAIQITGPQRMEVVDVPPPTLADGHIILKTERISVCGSDMTRYRQVLLEEEYPFTAGAPCHEVIGTVEESRVPGVEPGDRAIVLSPPGSYGGGVEYAHIPANRIIPVSKDGDPSVQLMAQPFGTVMHAFKRLPTVIGQSVAVVGQGPIGLSFTHAAQKLGAASVIAVESMAYRREWATQAGATVVVDAESDPIEQVRSLTDGGMVDVVVEASGTAEGVNLALELARYGGSMLSFGITEEAVIPVNYTSFTRREVNIVPSRSASTAAPAQSIREFVGLVERGWTDLSWMVTHRMAVSDVDEAYRMYDKRDRDSLKIVMEM